MQHTGPPNKRKKIIEPSCESSIVPVGLTPKTMNFPPSIQSASVSLGSRNSLRSESGSNQLELLPTRKTTPTPATSKPRERKIKRRKEVSVPHDSPAMSTRSKTPQQDIPASHTRSKRKLPLLI
ncbi:hypothetical protein GQ55_6G088500 [Panicum hallii var. hallii]|uniref:Uncharacterized protein n=1 Tax=Panicum hallii var. hallii TaxID=1504633 RepID=A0A2T7D5E7_9POAL|nr:hypothetical protein GQ55_6G088500 [Panicum hallii var. hallii]